MSLTDVLCRLCSYELLLLGVEQATILTLAYQHFDSLHIVLKSYHI